MDATSSTSSPPLPPTPHERVDGTLILGGTYAEANFWARVIAEKRNLIRRPDAMAINSNTMGLRVKDLYLVGSWDQPPATWTKASLDAWSERMPHLIGSLTTRLEADATVHSEVCIGGECDEASHPDLGRWLA